MPGPKLNIYRGKRPRRKRSDLEACLSVFLTLRSTDMTLKRYIPGVILLMLVWTINIAAQSGVIGLEEPNWIQQENELPGDPDWKIPDDRAAFARQIEGYASKASVNVGENISFYVNVTDGSTRFDLDIYRMGYYGGDGARRIFSRTGITTRPQPLPEADHTTGWRNAHGRPELILRGPRRAGAGGAVFTWRKSRRL